MIEESDKLKNIDVIFFGIMILGLLFVSLTIFEIVIIPELFFWVLSIPVLSVVLIKLFYSFGYRGKFNTSFINWLKSDSKLFRKN
jgi:hypothetical protein